MGFGQSEKSTLRSKAMKLILIALVALVVGLMVGCSSVGSEEPSEQSNQRAKSLEAMEIWNGIEILVLREQYEEALEELYAVIRLVPDYPDAHFQRGYVYSKLGNYERAVDDYTEAIRLNPNKSVAYNNRAAALQQLGNRSLADKDAKKACKLNSKYC
jgi:Flp pilus assembly protein TadD